MPNDRERIRDAVRQMARRYNTARRNHLELAAKDTLSHMNRCMLDEQSNGQSYEIGYEGDLITSIVWNGKTYSV